MEVIENPESIHLDLPTNDNCHFINPFQLVRDKITGSKTCLVILNQEIAISPELFERIWGNCELRICADGGGDRLLEYSTKHGKTESYLPHYIIGDLDSLSDGTKKFYEDRGVTVKQQWSQWHSDLDKSIVLCDLYFNRGNIDLNKLDDEDGLFKLDSETPKSETEVSILLLSAIGGRFDQTIHSINKLFVYSETKPNLDIKLWNSGFDEMILLIKKGENFVFLPGDKKNYNVGLLPLGQRVNLSTRGLKWDVTHWESHIYGSVSSSNRTVADTGFWIETDEALVVNLQIEM
ncbi:unnamed protein product [Kuraishia capsulata CBS 1993]|uniref:Thiamine pyrophosphokinase n=1 Tax=Kuraishia capsulata CBS 1993 TaxID=1382522 RepID=W6MU90_9ASCO|nr:uncharacterized protein KUCA_T00001470001 [Kuraishia capsulata CBS 1993]CDK25500.1 unnamed protein product [Kuraishia capsulata CBS 1993]